MNTAKKVNRAPYAAVGLVQMLALGSMYTWTFFKVNLVKDFPSWTTAQVNLNFTIMMCLFCLGGVLAGNSEMITSMARTLLHTMTQDKRDELLVQLVNKNRDKLLEKGRKAAEEKGVGVRLCDVTARKF